MRLYLVTKIDPEGGIRRVWFRSRSQAERDVLELEEAPDTPLLVEIEQVVLSKNKDAIVELLNLYA